MTDTLPTLRMTSFDDRERAGQARPGALAFLAASPPPAMGQPGRAAVEFGDCSPAPDIAHPVLIIRICSLIRGSCVAAPGVVADVGSV
jgi:hypothetical protein